MDGTQAVELYGTLMYVCIGISVLGFGLAVFLFFWLKIPALYAIETGRAQRKTIEQMLNQSSESGSLRMRRKGKRRKGEPNAEPGPNTAGMGVQPSTAQQSYAPPEDVGTTVVEQETSLLNQQAPAPAAPTPAPEEATTESLRPRQIFFEITEETIVIHTDETI